MTEGIRSGAQHGSSNSLTEQFLRLNLWSLRPYCAIFSIILLLARKSKEERLVSTNKKSTSASSSALSLKGPSCTAACQNGSRPGVPCQTLVINHDSPRLLIQSPHDELKNSSASSSYHGSLLIETFRTAGRDVKSNSRLNTSYTLTLGLPSSASLSLLLPRSSLRDY